MQAALARVAQARVAQCAAPAAAAPAAAAAAAAPSTLAEVAARRSLRVRCVFASGTKSGAKYNWHVGFEFTHNHTFRRWHAHFTGNAAGSPIAVTSSHFKFGGHKKTDSQTWDDDPAEALAFLQRLDRVFPSGWMGPAADPRPYRSV